MNNNFLRTMIVVALLIFTLMPTLTVSAAQPDEAAAKALDWLRSQQNDDGGFTTGFSAESNLGATVDAVVAVASAGQDPNAWTKDGKSPLDYLATTVADAGESSGDTAKLILAAVAAGKDPTDFAGTDLVTALNAFYDADSGAFEGIATFHMMAMLALAAAGEPVPQAAVTWLESVQNDDGGWSFDGSVGENVADTNSTALAIQALIAAGQPAGSPAIQKALDYLRGQQNEDGGFPYAKPSDFGTESDANSTAYVIQALVAAGQDPTGAEWTAEGGTPLDRLLALQIEESGAFNWKAEVPGENMLATIQAIPALTRTPFSALSSVPARWTPITLPVTGAAGLSIGYVNAAIGLVLVALGLALRQSRLMRQRGNGAMRE